MNAVAPPQLELAQLRHRRAELPVAPRRQTRLSDLPTLYLVGHGDTAWTESHRHTGLTDLPLSERGEADARRLGERLRGFVFARVFTSPLQRAARTCELCGFGGMAEVVSTAIVTIIV